MKDPGINYIYWLLSFSALLLLGFYFKGKNKQTFKGLKK